MCAEGISETNRKKPVPIGNLKFYFMYLLTEQHFTEVVGSEEFLNLGMEQVSSLIASDKLTIPTEEKVRARSPRSGCRTPGTRLIVSVPTRGAKCVCSRVGFRSGDRLGQPR